MYEKMFVFMQGPSLMTKMGKFAFIIKTSFTELTFEIN